MNKIVLSLLTILAVATAATGATRAYFTDVMSIPENEFTSGTVTLGQRTNLPLKYTHLLPGEDQVQTVGITYTGDVPADIYVGIAHESGFPWYNNLTDTSLLDVSIYDNLRQESILEWTPIKHFLTSWTQVASSVVDESGVSLTYDVHVRLKESVGNEAKGKSNRSVLFIYAVQAGGPVPTTQPWAYTP